MNMVKVDKASVVSMWALLLLYHKVSISELDKALSEFMRGRVLKPTRAAKKGTWTLDAKRRGRVPNWVLKQAKVGSKDALRRKFKDGHKFVA